MTVPGLPKVAASHITAYGVLGVNVVPVTVIRVPGGPVLVGDKDIPAANAGGACTVASTAPNTATLARVPSRRKVALKDEGLRGDAPRSLVGALTGNKDGGPSEIIGCSHSMDGVRNTVLASLAPIRLMRY